MNFMATTAGPVTASSYNNAVPSGMQSQAAYGVASGYKDVLVAVDQIVNAIDNLRSSLGISVPAQPSNAIPEVPTLASQLRALSNRLNSAGADLNDVLVHLNS